MSEKGNGNVKHIKKIKKTITIDETGEKCKLSMSGKIDFSDVGVYPMECWEGDMIWGQVYNNHFYFACLDNLTRGAKKTFARCTIYKDSGKRLGSFGIECNSIYPELYICAYNNTFFLVVEDEELGAKSGIIDLKKQQKSDQLYQYDTLCKYKVDIIDYSSCAENNLTQNYSNSYPYVYYNNSIYFHNYDKKDKPILSCVCMNKKTDANVVCQYNKLGESNLFFMDNKIYCGICKGKKTELYCFDLKNKKTKKILTYRTKKKSKNIQIDIDEICIYSQQYIIPLKGGRMLKKDIGESFFVHNQKYIFYIDSKNKLHRIDKENLNKDVIISKHNFTSVYCTEKALYLKDCDERLLYDEEDTRDYKVDIYTMDLDGKNLKKIKREK